MNDAAFDADVLSPDARCWRCRKARVPVHGIPCSSCRAALHADYLERRAANGGRLLYLPNTGPLFMNARPTAKANRMCAECAREFDYTPGLGRPPLRCEECRGGSRAAEPGPKKSKAVVRASRVDVTPILPPPAPETNGDRALDVPVLTERVMQEVAQLEDAIAVPPARSTNARTVCQGDRAVKRSRWLPEHDAQLRDLYPRTRTEDLPRLLGRSHSAIKNRVAAMHLRKDADVSMRRPWTPADDDLLRQLYATTSMAELRAQLHRTPCSVYGRADILGLNKTPAFKAQVLRELGKKLSATGGGNRFPKGNVPANKGLRHPPGWGPGRMKETQFKKGVATNWMPIGSERLVDGYRYTKVSDIRNVPWMKNWVATHVLLWETHHGRPLNRRTHALLFKNGDRTDVRLENLELITRGELMLRNSLHNLPAPLPQTIQLLGALKRKINRRTRNEEQNRRPA